MEFLWSRCCCCWRRRRDQRRRLVKPSSATAAIKKKTACLKTASCPSPPPSEEDDFYMDLHDVPNPSWKDLRATLVIGRNSLGPAFGSTIKVNTNRVCCCNKIPRDIYIHTATHSCIDRSKFGTMTRWYQEDDKNRIQVFRMFPGDDNVRNDRKYAPRVEAFAPPKKEWKRGDGWHEWSGTFTFLKLRDGAVFQLKHNRTYWSIQLCVIGQQDGSFHLAYHKLHDKASFQYVARDVRLQSVHVRILDDGTHHKVLINGELKVCGSFTDRTDSESNCPRWGFYSPSSAMDREILLFTTNVYAGKARSC